MEGRIPKPIQNFLVRPPSSYRQCLPTAAACLQYQTGDPQDPIPGFFCAGCKREAYAC